ncbi:HGL256Wp [Eremothecium sinecaudum]|uniref:HGL256Wp n=1 Tax=Eremothecium sinecaudum TaxID=45286 RepID=A0A0X8HV60_9SACH|nr:HGL256Wp [Eremothecium sinecaudum]AMD22084.1 HGL256Wp [Eremothecium sinecaudum]
MMAKQALGQFFGNKRLYFVCGKVYQEGHFANRIVNWFNDRQLPVVPVSPKGGSMEVYSATSGTKKLEIATDIPNYLKNINAEDLDGISVNFVTPPPVSISIQTQLRNAKIPVKSVWFQPGSWNQDCLKFAVEELGISPERVITDCVLVNGDAHYVKNTLKL